MRRVAPAARGKKTTADFLYAIRVPFLLVCVKMPFGDTRGLTIREAGGMLRTPLRMPDCGDLERFNFKKGETRGGGTAPPGQK